MSNIVIPNRGQNVISNYNGVDMDGINTAAQKRRAEAELAVCNRIGAVLVKTYPGREWKVICDSVGGVIIVACDSLSNDKGYFLRMEKYTMTELEQRAVKACSEILERYNISREKVFDGDTLETIERDHQGEALADDAAPESITKHRLH